MSLPSVGPISFNDLKLEFGDTYPVSLNEFYSGGSRVPVGATGALGPIPTAGQISLNQMHGGAGSLLTGAGWKSVSTTARFVAVNGQHIVATNVSLHSNDGGFTWLTDIRTPVYTLGQFAPTYLAGVYYYSYASQYIVKSTDGITWIDANMPWPVAASYSLYSTVGRLYGGDVLILTNIFLNAGYAYALYSVDLGNTWSTLLSGPSLGNTWSPLLSGPSLGSSVGFIKDAPEGLASGCDGLFMYLANGSPRYMCTSPDLVTWTNRIIYDTVGNALSPSDTYIAHTFNNVFMMFVLGYTVVSTDGVSFTAHPVMLPGRTMIYQLIHVVISPTYMLAVYPNDDGIDVAARSTNGIIWIAVAAPNLTPTQVSYVNGYWQVYSAMGVMKYVPV